MPEKYSAEKALAPLKVFQRLTVDYVFDRLYGPNDPVDQFLVADEVGLGKTMVARGVIARTIEHMWDRVERIDIIYICSNQAIAAQNLNRLNVLERDSLTLPTRMTLIPLQLQGQASLDENKVNFISLTPGTTFNLRSSTGVVKERALLCNLLRDLVDRPRGLHNMLRVWAGHDTWDNTVKQISLDGVSPDIIERFRDDVQAKGALLDELNRICDMFPRRRDVYPSELIRPRNDLVGRLRGVLSRACVEALQPDLIIMDEFQRFRDLLHGETEAADLLQELLQFSEGPGHSAKALLLSATPYRMLTLTGDDPDEGEHQKDFLETLRFLYGKNGDQVSAKLDEEMRAFRLLLQSLPKSREESVAARKGIEDRLRKVIARTERVASTVNRDSMMKEATTDVSVAAADLGQAIAVAAVARALAAPEIIEYWKSAPYLLNFMRDYKLKEQLKQQAEDPSEELLDALRSALPLMLDRDAIDRYAPLEPGNGRMRAIIEDFFGADLQRNLWIPASMPYYGEKRADPPLTKALVFSHWSMVPDAIAALLTYEAERRRGSGTDGNRYFQQRRARPLHFRQDHGRLTGLRSLLLIYPSPVLAEFADPLTVFSECEDRLSEKAMRKAIAKRLEPLLATLRQAAVPQHGSTLAEWAAPAVIDDLLGKNSTGWLEDPDGGLRVLTNEDGSPIKEEGFAEHIDALSEAASRRDFGHIPEDLSALLVDVAMGSPAVCALRALHRVAPELAWDDPRLLYAAAQVAWAFRTLFNQPDAVVILRQGEDDNYYWRRVLTYGASGNLQAVLDEYAHYLEDAEGLSARPPDERARGVARAMARALSIRPSQIDVDDLKVDGNAILIEKFQMRGRFAMRLADYRDEENNASRLGLVREAFNSPFRPFVLATTSVGQEGLDFHPYCYRVYHWNLPSNPVDLEQREGRVHRFKGHAVRLNLAECQADAVTGNGKAPDDPWETMFEKARSEDSSKTGLIPYWIYDRGSVRVERRVPMLPYSREAARLDWLKRSLAVYRLAFGQPRQDDLVNYLGTVATSELTAEELEDLQIRLDPVPPKKPA